MSAIGTSSKSLTSQIWSLSGKQRKSDGRAPRNAWFHDLRHSHATELLSAGVHPKIAQERLGYASIATTLDLYSHTMQSDAAQRLDAAFAVAQASLDAAK
jgi:site-specific recombinase XerD